MFEQDYLMRQIHEMIAVLMKMLFGLELPQTETVLINQMLYSDEFDSLKSLVSHGEIRLAERLLYESIDAPTAANLLKGYSFYQYLAQADDAFLEERGYTRREIADGVRRLAALFRAEHLADLFLPD